MPSLQIAAAETNSLYNIIVALIQKYGRALCP
jgi:hypothetical protein